MALDGRLYPKDNEQFAIEFQYFAETIKIGFARSVDERLIPLSSSPVNFDVSASAPTLEFTLFFNSFGESRDNTRLNSSYSKTLGFNPVSAPSMAHSNWVQVRSPEWHGGPRVWTLELAYPFEHADVLIDSITMDDSFYSPAFRVPRRSYWAFKGRVHYELPAPDAIYRPKKSIKKGPSMCVPQADVDAMQAELHKAQAALAAAKQQLEFAANNGG